MIAILMLLVTPAHATLYATEVCVKLNNNFDDAAAGDVWTNSGGTVKIRGALLIFVEYDLNGIFQTLTTVNASDTTGCHTKNLSSTRAYELSVASVALVNGVPVEAYDEWDAPSAYVKVLWGAGNRYTPTQAQTGANAFDVVPNTNLAAWRALAVGTFMVSMNNFGLDGDTPIKYANQCCSDELAGECSTCDYGSSDVGFIFGTSNLKFIIAHETGHRIARIRDGDLTPVADPNAPVNGCDGLGDGSDGHAMTTKEWQSTAIKEGFADFMAAWTWNDEESDCEFWVPRNQDLDLDGDLDVNDNQRTISCEGIPLATGLQSYVTARDWLMDVVGANAGGCTTPTDWRSTEYDVLRYFWDMFNDENVPVGELMDIYDDADPHNWAATYNGLVVTENGMYRLYTAADDNGYGTAHLIERDNGLDHW